MGYLRTRMLRPCRRPIMAMVAICLAFLVAPSVAHANTYGGAGRIAYAGPDAATQQLSHIWTMAADGSDKVDVTPTSTSYDADPAWSPDGTSIAFSRGPSFSAADIWRMDGDGGNPVQLTTAAPREREPAWSPDGSTIVFESGSNLVTMSAVDGSDRTVVGTGQFPSYSPNGQRIAFARFRSGYSEIFSMKADGTDVRNLTRTPSLSEFNPDWAPDGRAIVFQRSQAAGHEIWTMRPDGSVQYRITNNSVFDGFPSYSPDGTAFVFVRNGSVFRMNASGRPAKLLAHHSVVTGEEYTTGWQPLPCTITGTVGDDPAMVGTGGDDVLCGLGGDDVIRGSTGNDTILGGPGLDVLYGEGGNDTIAGAGGSDELLGGVGDDRLTGDAAKDIHRGGPGDDYLFAWDRAGGDRLLCGTGFNWWAYELNDIVNC